MIRRALHIFCSFWLVVLLLFGGTSKEAFHAFANHTDTIHREGHDKRLNIEKQHHHCDFLSFHLLPFDAPVTFFTPAHFNAATSSHFTPREFAGIAPYFIPGSGLRGPPAGC